VWPGVEPRLTVRAGSPLLSGLRALGHRPQPWLSELVLPDWLAAAGRRRLPRLAGFVTAGALERQISRRGVAIIHLGRSASGIEIVGRRFAAGITA
jgi:hypothetical protein